MSRSLLVSRSVENYIAYFGVFCGTGIGMTAECNARSFIIRRYKLEEVVSSALQKRKSHSLVYRIKP